MKEKSILTKENSLVLRGLAIIAIMLHNFLHSKKLGFSRENEMSFSYEKASHFFDLLVGGDVYFYEIFSFLGWIGVPVFIFLTGYGTACGRISNISKIGYARKQWIKLFILMFPAILLFAVGDILLDNQWTTFGKRLLYLTQLVNLGYPWLKCAPGVYWYFSLTFQLYLVYAIWGKYMNGRNLLFWSIATTVGLGLLVVASCPPILSVYRHCFTGWFSVFALGVWMGRHRDVEYGRRHSWLVDLLVFLCSALAVLWMNKWMLTWLFVPLVALVMWISCGLLVMRSGVLTRIFKWIGNLSACIFVCHPIVRAVICRVMLNHVDNMLIIIICYVCVTILVSLLYDKYYKTMLVRCGIMAR